MQLVFLVLVFAVIVIMMNIKITVKGKKQKMPLSLSILGGVLATVILYQIPPVRAAKLAAGAVISGDTIALMAVTYFITFLQRMMEQKQHLRQAQRALSAIFNSRRVNATVAPMLIGLLPSPAAAFIAGDIVNDACGDYLTVPEKATVTSYFRHISESCLPTYTSIILGLSLAGVATGNFLIGMLIPVIVLYLLGYFIYIRRVPKDTGVPKDGKPLKHWGELFQALWSIILIVALILAFGMPVWLAVLISVVLYFLINRLNPKSVVPYFRSAWEWNIQLNIILVMVFKVMLEESGAITLLPEAFQKLPLPLPISFALIFLVGTIIAGSNGIIAMCIPMAYAAIPDGGTALLILLMCATYIAMQVSPVHVCLTVISQYFHTDFGAMVKKTIPMLVGFVIFLIPYYYLLTLIPNF